MTRFVSLSVALMATGLLAGCFDIPDFRASRPAPATSRPVEPVIGDPLAPPAPTAGAAETACMEAGRASGFDVRGIVGTREVADAAGMPLSRDVILNAARGSQSIEVRCSFAYVNGQARIMTL